MKFEFSAGGVVYKKENSIGSCKTFNHDVKNIQETLDNILINIHKIVQI